MTEQTPPTGPDQPPRAARAPHHRGGGADDRVPGAGAARLSPGRDGGPENRPDETGDETSAAARTSGVRRCACCGHPLPPPTATQKKPRKYCPDGQGGYEQRHGVTCTKFGPIKEEYERVFGRDAVPGADLERLGELIAAATEVLGPASPLLTLLTGLTGTLTGVGDHLQDVVVDAVAETARARAAEQAALGREAAAIIERDAAHAQAQQAVLDRHAAQRDRDTQVRAAEQRATAAEAAQRHAEHEQARLRGENTQLDGRAQRADAAAARDRDRAEKAKRTIARQATKIVELTRQLTDANARADAERDRADVADRAVNELREATATRIAEIQTEATRQIETARTAADARVDAARTSATAAVERLGREHAEHIRRIDREHAAELAARGRVLQQQVHRAQREVAQLLADTEPDSEKAAPASERYLREGLARLAQTWTVPADPD